MIFLLTQQILTNQWHYKLISKLQNRFKKMPSKKIRQKTFRKIQSLNLINLNWGVDHMTKVRINPWLLAWEA